MPVIRLHLAQLLNMQKISALQNKINQSYAVRLVLLKRRHLQRKHGDESLGMSSFCVRSKASKYVGPHGLVAGRNCYHG